MYFLRCIPNQYTTKKVYLALCSLISCRTCLTNRDSILVLIYIYNIKGQKRQRFRGVHLIELI